ncbi:MAG: hypothetical protein Q8N16_02375 [bacterium]|nr:hypothetical protein [bacterium]
MVKISNPYGWKGAEKVLAHFEPELRKNLGSSVIVWPVTTGLAIVRKRTRFNHGYLIKLIAGPEKIEVRVVKLKQYDLNPEFTEQTIEIVQRTITKLLSNHH